MPEDRRPPKKWWDNCIDACHRHEIADDCNAFCGWLWYHGEEAGSPYREAREAFFHKQQDVCLEWIEALADLDLKRRLEDMSLAGIRDLLQILASIQYYCEYEGEAEDLRGALGRIDDNAIDGELRGLSYCSEDDRPNWCAVHEAGEALERIVRRVISILGI